MLLMPEYFDADILTWDALADIGVICIVAWGPFIFIKVVMACI